MLRHSPLFEFKSGDHICVFYRDVESLREMLVPYIAEGLRKGERCFCAQKEEVGRQLLYDLNFLGIDTHKALTSGALDIHTQDQAYFPNQRFEPAAMLDMLMHSIDDAAVRGFSGFRTAGELSWAVQGRNDCDQLLTYELMVEQGFSGSAAIGLCQYNVNEFAPEVLAAVTEAHRLNVAHARPNCFHSGLSVRQGNYSMEIVADKFVLDPKYYYVVQQNHPREIAGWGTAPSFDHATREADSVVELLEAREIGN